MSKLVSNHVCDACLHRAQLDTSKKTVADFGRTITVCGLGEIRFLCRDCWQRVAVRCDAWKRAS